VLLNFYYVHNAHDNNLPNNCLYMRPSFIN